MTAGVVIVGAGHGGVEAAASLRDGGFDGGVTIIDSETVTPYQRPPLSKQFLGGDDSPVPLRAESFFSSNSITLRRGESVLDIDTASSVVRMTDGSQVPYDRLVLATGAGSRDPRIIGSRLEGVCTLRTLDDARRLRERLHSAQRVVVIGGGFIGLEITAAAGDATNVTVVEPQDRVLARSVAPILSHVIQDRHRRAGSTILLGHAVAEITGRGGVVDGVVLDDGSRIAADVVVIGVGAVPNTSLAERAGLATDDGIVVDADLRTSDPRVFAIGDCAAVLDEQGRTRRLECVQNAVDQGRHVASRIIEGTTAPYCATPYFWTHQLDLRIQMAGLGGDDDDLVVLGQPDELAFSICRFSADRLVAVESVNRPRDHMAARKLLASGAPLRLAEAARQGFDLKDHLTALPT